VRNLVLKAYNHTKYEEGNKFDNRKWNKTWRDFLDGKAMKFDMAQEFGDGKGMFINDAGSKILNKYMRHSNRKDEKYDDDCNSYALVYRPAAMKDFRKTAD
jgi:hypothetical protein